MCSTAVPHSSGRSQLIVVIFTCHPKLHNTLPVRLLLAFLLPTLISVLLYSPLSLSLSSSIFSLLQFACFVDPPFTIYLYSFTHPPGVLPQSLAHYPSELYCLCFSTHKVSCACLCRFAPETTSLPRNYYYTRRSLHNPLDALIIDSTGSLI